MISGNMAGGRLTKFKGRVVSVAPFGVLSAVLLGAATMALGQNQNYDGSYMPEAATTGEAYLGQFPHTQDNASDNHYFNIDTSTGQYFYHENPNGVRQLTFDEWVNIRPDAQNGRVGMFVAGKMIGALADSMKLIDGAGANLDGEFNLEQMPPAVTTGSADFAAPFNGIYFKTVTRLPSLTEAYTQADGVISFYAYSHLPRETYHLAYFKGKYAHAYVYRSYAYDTELFAYDEAKVYVDFSDLSYGRLEVASGGYGLFERSYALHGTLYNLGGSLDITRNKLDDGLIMTNSASTTFISKNKFKDVETRNYAASTTIFEDLDTETSIFTNGDEDTGSKMLLTRAQGLGNKFKNNSGNTLSFTDVALADVSITNTGTATATGKFDITASAGAKGSKIANDGSFTFTKTLIDLTGRAAKVTGSGAFILDGSTLNLPAATFSQGKTASAGVFSTGLILKNGSVANFANSTKVDANVDLQAGTTLNLFNKSGVRLNKTISGSVKNAGILNMATGVPASKLNIEGDYTSAGGKILLDAQLRGDSASSKSTIIAIGGNSYNIAPDKVNVNLVDPVVATGKEVVQVITIAGGTNKALFTLDNRVEGGAYEYFLQKASDGHWYLSSTEPTVPPVEPPDPVDPPTPPVEPPEPVDPPTPPVEPPEPVDPPSPPVVPPSPPQPPTTPILRPEVGGYGANIRSAATMFDMRWHDRKGAERQANLEGRSYWLRALTTDGDYNTSIGQLHTDRKTTTLMAGADAAVWNDNATGEFTFGVFAGYGDASSTTVNQRSHKSAHAAVDGVSAGLYLDWRENMETERGLYVDAWLRYADFDAKVSALTYGIKSTSASAEIGYTYDLDTYEGRNIWIEPQAQIIYTDLDVDTIRDTGGMSITSGGTHGLARIGTRIGMDVNEDPSAGHKVFFQLDYLNLFKKPSLAISQFATEIGGSDRAQVGFGYEAKVHDTLTAQAGFDYLTDFEGGSDYGFNLALHMKF